MVFADTLEIKLELTVDKKTITIPGGNVQTIKLDLQPYGFTCVLGFLVSTRTNRVTSCFPFS